MLSKQYLAATDYKNVFPKIPSVVRAYYNKWKSNQDLKTLLAAHHEAYYKLLRLLSKPVDPKHLDVAASFQKRSSDKNRRETEQNLKPNFKNNKKTVHTILFQWHPPMHLLQQDMLEEEVV